MFRAENSKISFGRRLGLTESTAYLRSMKSGGTHFSPFHRIVSCGPCTSRVTSSPSAPGMHEERKQLLAEFVAWTAAHITGDEKGEAQIFLDRLFQAFGQKGVREAGATLEMRVKKADAGGTAFADLVWKPIVLIEMKKRGVDLSKHYHQAFDYWTRLVPGRP